ncbi:hypothetical protein BH10BAC4_BH10BAC4_22430 [soil metagenome]
MSSSNLNSIGKYALILSVTYLLQILLVKVITDHKYEFEMGWKLVRTSLVLVVSILLNISTAIIVFIDMRSRGVKTKYVIIATLLYRPAGVMAFLLYSIYGNENDVVQKGKDEQI